MKNHDRPHPQPQPKVAMKSTVYGMHFSLLPEYYACEQVSSIDEADQDDKPAIKYKMFVDVNDREAENQVVLASLGRVEGGIVQEHPGHTRVGNEDQGQDETQ